MADQPQNNKTNLIIAFVAGAAIAAIVCFLVWGNKAGAPTSTGSSSQAETTQAATPASQSEAFDNANIDFAKTFPSWNADSQTLAKLIDFVTAATTEGASTYVEPEARIATFDMDGTIICEKAPVYVDYVLTWHRVLDDPSYTPTEEERSSMEQIREHALAEGVDYKDVPLTKTDLIATAFAGMTPKEFRAYVQDFADTTQVVGFDSMTYSQSFYKPMLEVIDYLRANDFDVWIVSACEREVTRAMVERLGIPLDHVVASNIALKTTNQGDKEGASYNMEQNEDVLLSSPRIFKAEKANKPIAIMNEIGRRPILAFGNSSGDYSMLNFAQGNTEHQGQGFFVVCDDTEREYGNEEKAADFNEKVAKENWVGISMRDDWATIYGEGVKKTSLPGPASAPATSSVPMTVVEGGAADAEAQQVANAA